MKVVGICFSPRVKGNSEIMLQEALLGAKEAGADVELIRVAGKSIAPCDACNSCRNNGGKCHINDDMQEIYTKLEGADGIVIGTPTYMANVTAQGKTFMDRTYGFAGSKTLMGKVGGVVITQRTMGGGAVLGIMYTYFANQRMLAAGGTIGTEMETELYKDKEAIKGNARAMKDAKSVGKNVVRVLNRLSK